MPNARGKHDSETEVKPLSIWYFGMANAQKTAIVTGASQGIGAGLVEALLNRSFSVVANSRNIIKANPFPASANLALVDGDIADPSTATTIVDTSISRFGRIDVLVNNAGIYFSKRFTDYTIDDLRALVSVNIEGFAKALDRPGAEHRLILLGSRYHVTIPGSLPFCSALGIRARLWSGIKVWRRNG